MLDTMPIDARSIHQPAFAQPTAPKYLDSRILFEGTREIRIDHGGQEYRLRQTRNGKLILTK